MIENNAEQAPVEAEIQIEITDEAPAEEKELEDYSKRVSKRVNKLNAKAPRGRATSRSISAVSGPERPRATALPFYRRTISRSDFGCGRRENQSSRATNIRNISPGGSVW